MIYKFNIKGWLLEATEEQRAACHERKGGVKERSPGGEGEGYVVTYPAN